MNIKIFLGMMLATVVILVGGLILFSSQESDSSKNVLGDQVISNTGLHWHANLAINIKGGNQEIPADVGLAGVHQPIHTHDANGTIHMEMNGLVKKEDLKINRFFEIWSKQFNSNCIFDKCNGVDGKVKMFINGQESQEFENYSMRDGDSVEIRYE